MSCLICKDNCIHTPGPDWHHYALVISNDIQHLTGKGEEWLIDHDEQVIARFINGELVTNQLLQGNNDVTKTAS